MTNHTGQLYERLEYTPYGETWIEWRNAGVQQGETTPYRFTGKEKDEETGLYYYGARYLDPKTSRWLSADPAMGEYLPGAPASDEARQRNGNLPGQGGVFNLVNLHVYHYAGNNPVKYVDPDGRFQTESPLQKKNSDTNNERGYQVSVSNHSNATWFVDLITGWTSVLSKSELSRSESGIKNDDGNFSLSGGLADIEIFLLRNPENKGAIADKKAMEVYAAAFGGEIKDGILTAPKDHTYSQVRNRMGVIWGLVAYTIGHGGNQTALMEGVTLGDEWNNLSGEDKKIIVDMVNQFIKNGDLKLEH